MKDTVEDMINRFLERQELKAHKADLESARAEARSGSAASASGLAVIRADIAVPESRQVRRARERAARRARLGGYL